jgi:glutamate 5-kinase
MQAKVDAASWAWKKGVGVVVANGMRPGVIADVLNGYGEKAGGGGGRAHGTCSPVRMLPNSSAGLPQGVAPEAAAFVTHVNAPVWPANRKDVGTLFTAAISRSTDVQYLAEAARDGARGRGVALS